MFASSSHDAALARQPYWVCQRTRRLTGRGAGSRAPLEFRWAGVTWFRNGLAVKAVGYHSRSDALKAVTLGD
jgi:hypothetical protein